MIHIIREDLIDKVLESSLLEEDKVNAVTTLKQSTNYDILHLFFFDKFPIKKNRVHEIKLFKTIEQLLLDEMLTDDFELQFGCLFEIQEFVSNSSYNLIIESESLDEQFWQKIKNKAKKLFKKAKRKVKKGFKKAKKVYKNIKKKLPRSLQKLLSKGEFETGEFFSAMSALPKPVFIGTQVVDAAVPGIPVGTLAALAVYSAQRTYNNKLSAASKACGHISQKHYRKYNECIKNFRKMANTAKVNTLIRSKSFCDKTKDKEKCIQKLNKEILKVKQNMERIRIKRLASKSI